MKTMHKGMPLREYWEGGRFLYNNGKKLIECVYMGENYVSNDGRKGNTRVIYEDMVITIEPHIMIIPI